MAPRPGSWLRWTSSQLFCALAIKPATIASLYPGPLSLLLCEGPNEQFIPQVSKKTPPIRWVLGSALFPLTDAPYPKDSASGHPSPGLGRTWPGGTGVQKGFFLQDGWGAGNRPASHPGRMQMGGGELECASHLS